MRVLLDDLHVLDLNDVVKCDDCRVHDDSADLCGWHEDVVAAWIAVELFEVLRAANPGFGIDHVALTAEVERLMSEDDK